MRLYCIRHGVTDVNRRGVYSGSTDHPLNQEGIHQAESISQALSHIRFDQVITSSLLRTRQTAEYIVPDKRLHQAFNGLDEIHFGQWEGRHYQEIERNDSENYAAWSSDWKSVAPPEGENFNQFSKRIEQTFMGWLQQAESSELETVLFVGHQGTLRCILLALLKMPADAFWHFTFQHAAYSVIDIHQRHAVIQQINIPV